MQIYIFGVPCIGHGSRLCLFIICFASEHTSCLNEANRIDLPGFFSIPCSHQASKECTMFHAVLMNGATPACSSVLCLFATSVFLQAENVSRLSSPGTRRHVGTNLSSVFSLWQCVHAHQQPRLWVSGGSLPYNHLVILYRHLQAIQMAKFGLRRYQTHSYVKPRGVCLLWAVARFIISFLQDYMVIWRESEWLKELIKGKTYQKPFISVHRDSSYSLHIIPKQKIHVYYSQSRRSTP